ncbi:hypothetical protein [Nonomuraea salmonea]|uniref:hypothetical protein n=1 Tax=Nonomuraea salmonea TaxID=46181 RepID=UPI0031F0145A
MSGTEATPGTSCGKPGFARLELILSLDRNARASACPVISHACVPSCRVTREIGASCLRCAYCGGGPNGHERGIGYAGGRSERWSSS